MITNFDKAVAKLIGKGLLVRNICGVSALQITRNTRISTVVLPSGVTSLPAALILSISVSVRTMGDLTQIQT